jgi:hypothetical protein
MHDGGGGVAGTEVDAEAHGEFRGDQGRALCCSSPPTASSCGLLFRPGPDRVKPGRCRKGQASRAVTMAAVDSL